MGGTIELQDMTQTLVHGATVSVMNLKRFQLVILVSAPHLNVNIQVGK